MKKSWVVVSFALILIISLSVFVSAGQTKQYITNDAYCSSTGLFSFGILNSDIHDGNEAFIGSNVFSTFVTGYATRASNILGRSSPTMCLGSNSINLWSDEQASAGDCSDSDICRNWGVLIGGYLYAGSGISSHGILIGAYSSSVESATSYGSSVICKLWNDVKDGSSYDTYASSSNFKRLSTSSESCISPTYNYGSVSDRAGEDDNICPIYGNSHCVAKSQSFGDLVPGVYVMAMGIRTVAPYNRGDHAESHLFPAGSLPTPNSFWKSPPYKSTTPFFVISNRMLTASEIRSNFPNSEIESHFCEAADYDKHPITGACCGNDATDIGLKSEGYYCKSSSWTLLKSDGTECVENYECANSYCCAGKCSSEECVTPDTTPPTYSSASHNSTLVGQSTKFSLYVNDNIALHPKGQYIFSTNNTGTWVNNSAVNFTATPSWANVTKTLNSTIGIAVGYRWYLTDNAGNRNNTKIYVLTTTTENGCGDGNVDDGEECDDGNAVNTDDCTNDCKDYDCGDTYCNGDETCTLCSHDCGMCTPWEDYNICGDCVGAAYIWCINSGVGECVSNTGGCDSVVNEERNCPTDDCVEGVEEYLIEGLTTDEDVQKLIKALDSGCGLSFEFGILDILPGSVPAFPYLSTKRIVKILNITADLDTDAVLHLTLNESELDLKFSPENITIFIGELGGWLSLTDTEIVDEIPNDQEYIYKVRTGHFSLFLITEPELCGNGVFDTGFEVCDGSTGVTNCTACVCDSGYDADGSGNCGEELTGGCSPIGNETCKGYTLYECGSDLKWDNKGKVIGECSVECSPIGNMSCQGEIPLKCGTDYQWDLQSKISGLCGYVSTNPLGYNTTGDRCGNGYCNYDEDEYSCPEDCEEEDDEEPNWGLIALVAGIAILILILVIVLFKIFSKERRGGMPPPNRRLPPEHRPGPKREPGRPLEHNLPVGRPAVGQGNYPRRRYPSR